MEGSIPGGAFARLKQAARRCARKSSASRSLWEPRSLESLWFISFWKAEN